MAILTLAVFCSMFVDSGTQELRAKGRRKKNTTWVMFIFDFFFGTPDVSKRRLIVTWTRCFLHDKPLYPHSLELQLHIYTRQLAADFAHLGPATQRNHGAFQSLFAMHNVTIPTVNILQVCRNRWYKLFPKDGLMYGIVRLCDIVPHQTGYRRFFPKYVRQCSTTFLAHQWIMTQKTPDSAWSVLLPVYQKLKLHII